MLHTEIVTTALFLLDGHRRVVDTEDIAVKAHEMAPGRFAWKKYPDQINLELVRVSLSDAKKEVNGHWVDGSGRTGWSLTEAGRSWAAGMKETVQGSDLSKTRQEGRGGSIDERRWRAERNRIGRLLAWDKWRGNQAVLAEEAEEVFRIDVYTVGQLRSRKISRLIALFEDDPKVGPFLRCMRDLVESRGDLEIDHV